MTDEFIEAYGGRERAESAIRKDLGAYSSEDLELLFAIADSHPDWPADQVYASLQMEHGKHIPAMAVAILLIDSGR